MPAPPIYIIGRQHSGNTMLASMLGRHPELLALREEGTFFEHRPHVRQLPPDEQASRIGEIIEGGLDFERQPQLRAQLAERLREQVQETGPSSDPVQLYRTGMQWLTEQRDATRWAQKATSYVFYVDAILETIPNARLLFLARNPLDIAASLKRRGEWRRALRMVWGWNRGTAAAVQRADTDPDHVQLIRYEDLVRTPRETMQNICSFAALQFEDDLLEVPHVNRSETPYNQQSNTSGINASRVHYYPNVLTSEEEAVVRGWTNADLLSRCYPDLPTARDAGAVSRTMTNLRALGASAHTLLTDHLGALVSEPRHVFDRIRRRIG